MMMMMILSEEASKRVEGGGKISIKPLTVTSNESRKVFNSIKNSQRLTNVYRRARRRKNDSRESFISSSVRISSFNQQNLKSFSHPPQGNHLKIVSI